MAETTELDTKFCKNCKRDISAGNFVMHEMHCMRNITLCKHCHEPVPKAEIDQHFEELHAKIGCEKCGKQVEKSHLEKHEEEECSKRPMRCTYCELETPQEELASHLEYCGTRTEECHKCGQFIMKKDEDRHETSKCTYPTPKPVPDNNSNRPIGGQEVLIPTFRNDPHYDPFVFDEMHRLLRPEDVLGAAGGTANPIVNDTRKEKMKFSKSKTNKKSEINKQRERVQNHRTDPVQNREPVNSQEEQDRLLAMHLAHDLNENDNIEDMIRQFDKPSLVTRGGQSRSFDRNMADGLDIEPDVGDSSLLPCEFCGVPFPLDDLVNHQSNCTDDPLSSLMPQINNRDDPGWSSGRVGDGWSSGIVAQETIPQELDNRLRSQDNSRQQPSVINNLDYGAVQNMYASDVTNTVIHGDEDDMFMLPCEFCNDLFPQDVLVQHQAVCEQPNSSLTSVQRTPKKQNTEPGVLTDRHNDTSHRQSSRSGHDEPPSWHLRDTLHKYGVEMKEPKVPSSRRYQGTHDSDEENQTTPRRLSQPRKTDSAARTRSTLNDLLTPDLPTSNINYLGHITKQKQSKDNVNVSRQNQNSRTTPTNVLRSTQGYVPTGARGDSRTSKLTNAVRGTRGELEVNGSSPLDSRHSSRSTGSTLNSSSRTRNLPSNSVTSTRTTQERGSRTRPFDYGTNKNTRTPNRRYQDQF